ncbi:MAG: LSU ribosomal protein L24p (L26e) [uncultured Chthoniobacterales bacterium]|uniref:Large ribosomal subunit protein uL24 n=1 Tax=uncultured Chthoniobacterales bacterium TaxID=1836801 RepID=A0A6J4HBL5_9BACT|nr:MAG: LSU ribosomal protein L24p (L26e) [uncultured Chthoniobacterales bacterium]
MNRIKLHVRKGDQVEVIAGNHKGSTGKVLDIFARKQRVVIEGVRMIKKHMRKSQDNPQGSIAEREGPIHISNVKVVERGERAEDKKGGAKKSAKGKADAPKAAAKKASRKTKGAKQATEE